MSKTSFGIIYSAIIIILGIMYFVYKRIDLYIHRNRLNINYYEEPPGIYSPAELSMFLRQSCSMKDISATILDLVRRNQLTIKKKNEFYNLLFIKKEITDFTIAIDKEYYNENKLRKHEKFLINWLLIDIGQDGEVDLKEIQTKLKKSRTFTSIFRGNQKIWEYFIQQELYTRGLIKVKTLSGKTEKQIEDFTEKGGFVTSQTHVTIPFKYNILPILPLLSVIFGFFVSPTFFIGAISLKLFDTPLKKYLTKKGIEHYFKWKAFKKYLLDFSLMNEAEVSSLIIWEEYLVYAVSLGVADKVVKNLNIIVPKE